MKIIQKKKLQTNLTYEYHCKILNKMVANGVEQQHMERITSLG